MTRIVYITRPITPQQDEGSKNFMVNLASHIHSRALTLCFLTVRGQDRFLPRHIAQIPYHSSSSFSVKTRLAILLFLLQTDADIIHTSFILRPMGSFLVQCIVRIRKLKTIQTIPSLHTRSPRIIRHLVYGNHVISVSRYTEKLLRKANIENVHRIPPGVSPTAFTKRRKKNVIAIVGELHRLRSFNLVRELVPLLRANLPRYRIVLAFRTVNKSSIERHLVEKLRRQFSHDSMIEYIDVIKNAPEFLGSAKLVIHPALATLGKFDYPLVLLESLSCGTPTIISPISPMSELGQFPGVITPKSNTPKGFALATTRALRQYKSLSQNARKTVLKHFNIKNIADQYRALYEHID